MNPGGRSGTDESMEDYLARLNLEGNREVWKGNHPKIDFILDKAIGRLAPGMKIAEFGIGDGHLLRRLHRARMQCTGLDISSYLVKYHSEQLRGKARILRADIADPNGYELDNQDAVFCLDVLEHIGEEEYRRAIANIYKVLSPGGWFIGSVPFDENLDNEMVFCPKCGHNFHRVGHKQAFDADRLKRSLKGMFVVRELGAVRPVTRDRPQELSERVRMWIRNVRHRFRSPPPLARGETCYFIAERTA